MKQRVGITLALLYDPQLLILDKPTLGLDPELWICFRNLLSDLPDERIVILSTCIAVVNKGKLLCAATPKDLLKELDSKVRELTKHNNDLVLAT